MQTNLHAVLFNDVSIEYLFKNQFIGLSKYTAKLNKPWHKVVGFILVDRL